MPQFKTHKQYEAHLNAMYFDNFSEEQAIDNFIYLTNKSRVGGTTTESHIRKCYQQRRLGELLRKKDPIAFYSGFSND